jgi:hypothetical protein
MADEHSESRLELGFISNDAPALEDDDWALRFRAPDVAGIGSMKDQVITNIGVTCQSKEIPRLDDANGNTIVTSGSGRSSMGHTAIDINGTTYSFGENGWARLPTTDYLKRNDFRDATGHHQG